MKKLGYLILGSVFIGALLFSISALLEPDSPLADAWPLLFR